MTEKVALAMLDCKPIVTPDFVEELFQRVKIPSKALPTEDKYVVIVKNLH